MNNITKIGQIKKLFISSVLENKRIEKNSIKIDLNGIIDDKFYNKNNDRSILLTSIDAYKLMEEKNIKAHYGQLGENILVDFNPYSLEKGTKILIGNTILEITIECTICKFLTKIDKKVPKLLKKDRGVFAKVIKGGFLNLNDSINIIN
ncbi:MAG: MOSC domain-containing protein [Arcobacter sp.]|nr:MAG: MOSC domain-containing protein [Arcobacter sp.]